MPLLDQVTHFLASFTSPFLPSSPSAAEPVSLCFSRNRHFHPLLNFGVLEHSSPYTLYRSSLLGKWGLKLLERHLNHAHLPFPKTIIYLNYEGYNGTFPLLGHFALEEFLLQDRYQFHFFHPFGTEGTTYLDGFNPYNSLACGDTPFPKEIYLGKDSLPFFKEVPNPSPLVGNIQNFYRILDIILDPNRQPVLFHCLAGKHRTGMVALAIRYLQGGDWIEGKKNMIYSSRDKKHFSLNPAQYEYFLHNQRFFRFENIAFAETFYQQDPQFAFWRNLYLRHQD